MVMSMESCPEYNMNVHRYSLYYLSRSRFIPLLTTANDAALVVVVGTKVDLLTSESHMRQVSQNQGHELCREVNAGRTFKNIPYFETSSLTGDNVDRVFDYILSECLPLEGDGRSSAAVRRSNSTVDLERPKNKDKEGGGCKC